MLDVIVGGVTVMKNTNRALRRHHHERMVQRAMRIPYLYFDYYHRYTTTEEHRLLARKISNNQCVCSCQMCRNIRHNGWETNESKMTFAERRNKDSFNDQMEDIDFPGDLGDNDNVWLNDEQ